MFLTNDVKYSGLYGLASRALSGVFGDGKEDDLFLHIPLFVSMRRFLLLRSFLALTRSRTDGLSTTVWIEWRINYCSKLQHTQLDDDTRTRVTSSMTTLYVYIFTLFLFRFVALEWPIDVGTQDLQLWICLLGHGVGSGKAALIERIRMAAMNPAERQC